MKSTAVSPDLPAQLTNNVYVALVHYNLPHMNGLQCVGRDVAGGLMRG
jgi:hypothetical protein